MSASTQHAPGCKRFHRQDGTELEQVNAITDDTSPIKGTVVHDQKASSTDWSSENNDLLDQSILKAQEISTAQRHRKIGPIGAEDLQRDGRKIALRHQ